MLKKLFLSFAALPTIALSAQAADLPAQKSPPPAPPPVFSWTGFHLGFNRGFGGAVSEARVALAAPGLGGTATRTFDQASGWFVGGQIGYDYQFENGVVLGVETDMQWSDIRSSHQATTIASNPLLLTNADTSHSLDWFGTTRGRVGYSFGRMLPYLTGGVAYGQVEARGAQALAAGLVSVGGARETNVGWAAGAGLDFALSPRLSARAEYLYLQLPGVSGPAVGLTPPPLPPLVGSFSTGLVEAHMVRGGMNYRFGGLGDLAPSMPQGSLFDILFQKPELDWTGFYVGVNGGYGGGVVDGVTGFAQPGLAFSTSVSNRTGGAVAGGQAGYAYQFADRFVVGVETDAQWSGVQAWHQATTVGGPNGYVFTDTPNAMTWFGTTRARLGLARGYSLSYVTGGVAYGEITASGTQAAGALFTGAGARSQVGWTVGSGTEYALAPNLSLRADYLYVSFAGVSGPAAGIAPAPFAGAFSTGRFATHVTRIGLNWRFGGAGPAPVVAKY
ncbi:outer membrane protein [Methylocystis sp. ATCC 49242]|uniref:outer membrane protein n=1 Tax=Methylocystis sp. ATCC 49242 TaxID=622637 RepID=UPI0001F87E5C|nr:outer membrane beta-barrel protein [Methylocystis sp. ATCC 49242]